MTTYLLLWLIIVHKQLNPTALKQKAKLKWSLQTNPIKYGEPVRLTCNVPSYGHNKGYMYVRQWLGGRKGKTFMCNNDTCNLPRKYQVKIYDSTPSFDLIVNNFTEADFNIDYTCIFDFGKYRSSLKRKNATIIYDPKPEEVTDWSEVVNGSILINITVDKIKPEPVCFAVFTNKAYSIVGDNNHRLNVMAMDNTTGNFSKVIITGTVHSGMCIGKLIVDCCLMTTEKSLLRKRMNICHKQEVPHSDKGWDGIGPICIVGIVLLALIVSLIVARVRYSRKQHILLCEITSCTRV